MSISSIWIIFQCLLVFYDDKVMARTNMIHAKLALSKISSVIIRELIPLNKQGSWCLLQGRRPLHMKEHVALTIWCGSYHLMWDEKVAFSTRLDQMISSLRCDQLWSYVPLSSNDLCWIHSCEKTQEDCQSFNRPSLVHRLTITIGKHHTCHLCTWRVQVAWV